MFETLDAILATAAVVLGLSLIVQSIQQIVKQFFDLKSVYMRAQLLALFSRPSQPQPQLTNWKSFSGMAKGADDFAKRIVAELEARLSTFGFTNLHLIEEVDLPKFKEILGSLPSAGDPSLKHEFDRIIGGLDRWFDLSKRAFQDHYERRMKPWAVAISAVVVLGLNANLLDIYKEFSRDKTLRGAGVAIAQQYVVSPRERFEFKLDTVTTRTNEETIRSIRAQVDSINAILDNKTFQLWRWENTSIGQSLNDHFLRSMIGWLAMILLVSLGAPFWYDFLKAVTGLKDRAKGAKQ